MTLGITVGAIHGTTAATGADGTTRSTIGATGDGAVLGTTEATGAHTIHGIHTMSEDGIRTTDSTAVLESATADTFRRTAHMCLDSRQSATQGYLPTTDARHSEEVPASVQAQAAARQAAESQPAAAPQRAAAGKPQEEGR